MEFAKIGKLGLGFAFICFLNAPSHAEKLYGTLKKINDSGTIVIGNSDLSVPLSYLNDKQEPVGYTIELCLKVVEAIRKRLGKHIKVEFQQVNPQTRIPLLANGTIDIECGSTTNKLERQKQAAFALITYSTGTRLLVKKNSGIREIEDLHGKSVAFPQGTTNERAIRSVAAEKGLKILLFPVRDHTEGFKALESGLVDCYSTDHILLIGLISKAKNPNDYEVVGRFLTYDPYGIMVRADDSEFLLVVNSVLAGLFRSGEIYKIYSKWFDPLNEPLLNMLRHAFEIQSLPE